VPGKTGDDDVDPVYVECPVDGSVHDTLADASTFRAAPAGSHKSALRRESRAFARHTARPVLPKRRKRDDS